MPGLIDMHWHAMLVRPAFPALLTEDIGHLNLQAGAEAAETLLRGFTTVGDMGGPVFALKRAIDEGVLPGPRIYLCRPPFIVGALHFRRLPLDAELLQRFTRRADEAVGLRSCDGSVVLRL